MENGRNRSITSVFLGQEAHWQHKCWSLRLLLQIVPVKLFSIGTCLNSTLAIYDTIFLTLLKVQLNKAFRMLRVALGGIINTDQGQSMTMSLSSGQAAPYLASYNMWFTISFDSQNQSQKRKWTKTRVHSLSLLPSFLSFFLFSFISSINICETLSVG